MKHPIKLKSSLIAFSFAISLPFWAQAQVTGGGNYVITLTAIASGGATGPGASTGGTFTLEGTMGQAAAGMKQKNPPITFQPGFWTAPPAVATAAAVTVGGRILTAGGNGIRNARITISGADGTTRTVISGSFGYYQFDDVPSGATYIISVRAKRYVFENAVQAHSILDDTDDIDFIAIEAN